MRPRGPRHAGSGVALGRRAGRTRARVRAWREVGDGPDRWVPPSGEGERERRGGRRVGLLGQERMGGAAG
jgi:hypothetical protein